MAYHKRKRSKCKPSVYLSVRPNLTPLLTQAVTSLSRHVTIRGTSDDPETAYLSISECDVFVCLLNCETCQQLLALYELGVAIVLQRPVIMVRDMNLALSQFLIPPHFYTTEILVAPSKARSTSQTFPGKTVHSHNLGDVLAYGYENSVLFSPESLPNCIDELLSRIFGLALGRLDVDVALNDRCNSNVKPKKKPAVKIAMTVGNDQHKTSKPHSFKTQTFDGVLPEVSLIPLTNHVSYMADATSDEKHDPMRSVLVKFPRKVDELTPTREDIEQGAECAGLELRDQGLIATTMTTTPLPSPTAPQDDIYYPSALPTNPIDLSFPPFQIENLDFNKNALAIAKSDRLPSIIRRRIMRKGL